MRTRTTYLVFGIFLSTVFFDCSKDEPKVDAETGASETYVVDRTITLPPQSELYTVLGFVDGLKEFVVQYGDKLYRGGEPYSNDAVTELKKMGITTIISVTPSDVERFRANLYGFHLIEIPFASTTGPSASVIQKFIDAAQEFDGTLYLHAHGGQFRAGIMGLAYRIYVQNWNADRAISEFKQLGGNVQDANAMIQCVLTYSNTNIKNDDAH